MPGIVGLLTRMPRATAERELRRMVEALLHEPFYVAGTWCDESLGVYIGWVARKGSFADGMPLWNERGDVVLVFSGEEFPEAGTARRLKEKGHTLDTDGPSYLVHLAEEDPSFPAGLNGRFHGLLVDRTGGTATLFNDRYGMHRIYYHEAKEAFYFAAEAKAILAVRPELRRADPRGLGEFVACGCVLDNRSLFQGVYVLPAGAAWTCRDGSVERRRAYFQPRAWEEQDLLEPEQYYREVRDIFSRNLPRYFEAREPTAMSLTGGLDTRMTMAGQKSPPGFLPCYTFGGMFRDSQDVLVARQVARVCEQSHEVIAVGENFLARFPSYAERTVYLTDGCVAVNHAPDLYLNEMARTIAPIRITGNYGGEVLRRVRALALANDDVCLRLIADGNRALGGIRTDRGPLIESTGRLPAVASRGVLEFLRKAEYAYDYGMPQSMARIDHLLSPLRLERLFLGRHKFSHFRVWYRDALSRYIREVLLDPRTLSRPYLEPKRLEAILRGHIKGDRNYTAEIHKVLTLELLHRLFLDVS